MPSPDRPDQPFRLLRTPWRALRRRVLVHRRGLAALLLVAAVVSGLDAVRAPAPATVAVWTAAHDLAGGGELGPEDLRRRWLPGDAVPAGTMSYAALTSRRLAGPMRAGEPFTDRRVLGADLLAAYPGRTAVPVRLADGGLADLLDVGDRVDLVRTDPQDQDPPALIAPRAAVLAVVSDDPGSLAGTGSSGGSGAGGLVLFAVEPDAAPEVAAAGAAGYLTVALPG